VSEHSKSQERDAVAVLGDRGLRTALRRLALADLVLFVASAFTAWCFPATFVFAVPILVVILIVAFVGAVVTAVCICPASSWICRLSAAGSMAHGFFAPPPDA